MGTTQDAPRVQVEQLLEALRGTLKTVEALRDDLSAAGYPDGYVSSEARACCEGSTARANAAIAKAQAIADATTTARCGACKGTGRQQRPTGTKRECGYCGGTGKAE